MPLDYEPLDLAEVQTEAQRVSAEPGVSNEEYLEKFVKLPERDGYVLMRFLPRKKGNKLFCATRIHTLTNPSITDPRRRKRSFHCPKVLVQTERGPRWQGDCIICKYYSDLWQQSEGLSGKAQDDLQNKARELKAVERYYYNVIVRQVKDPKTGEIHRNVGPKIYSCGKTVHAKIMRAIVGDESAGEKPLGDITHPTNGRDFRLVKKVVKGGGGKEYPNYDQSTFESPSPAGEMSDVEAWLENLHDLQSLRVLKPAEELRHALKVHVGMIKEGGNEADDDLAEFRNAGGAVQDTVREELAVHSTPAISETVEAAGTSKAAEELLADDDFMKELEGM